MKKKSLVLVVLLLLVGLTSGYVASTYAKYTSNVAGSGTAYVAKWAFADDNDYTELNIELADTVDATTLVADRIAPGTSGALEIEITNEHTEVGVDFTVTLGNVTNKPANLKFYSDSSFTTEITPGSYSRSGHLQAGYAGAVAVPIYWQWEYYTSAANDATDTTRGEAGGEDGDAMTISLSIVGTQVEPSADPMTNGLYS